MIRLLILLNPFDFATTSSAGRRSATSSLRRIQPSKQTMSIPTQTDRFNLLPTAEVRQQNDISSPVEAALAISLCSLVLLRKFML